MELTAKAKILPVPHRPSLRGLPQRRDGGAARLRRRPERHGPKPAKEQQKRPEGPDDDVPRQAEAVVPRLLRLLQDQGQAERRVSRTAPPGWQASFGRCVSLGALTRGDRYFQCLTNPNCERCRADRG